MVEGINIYSCYQAKGKAFKINPLKSFLNPTQ